MENGKRKGENGKLSTPSASLVHPVSGGQLVTTANANANTHFRPLRQFGKRETDSRRSGEK